MATLEARLQADMKDAMKAGQQVLLATIRHLRSQIQYAKMEAGDGWSDELALAVAGKAARMRQESIAQYEKGGRSDLAAKERQELEIIRGYLPEQLSEEDLSALVDEAIAQVGATTPKDMGKAMGAVMPKVQGRADGKTISSLVRRKLTSG